MFNVIIKLTILSLIVSFAGSCNSSSSVDADNDRADTLLNLAKEHFSNGNDSMSLVMLDSIDHSCQRAIEARKEARLLRPQVVERLSMAKMSEADSLMVVNQILGEKLRGQLEFVSGTGVEGYFVGKGTANIDVRSTPGLHSRVSPDYHFYLIATTSTPVRFNSVELRSGDDYVRSENVNFDGERNSRNSTNETITFTEAESYPLGQFVSRHASDPIKVSFIGSSGAIATIDLPLQQRNAVLSAYGLVEAVNADRHYRLSKDRYARQVEIARKQLADVAAK